MPMPYALSSRMTYLERKQIDTEGTPLRRASEFRGKSRRAQNAGSCAQQLAMVFYRQRPQIGV